MENVTSSTAGSIFTILSFYEASAHQLDGPVLLESFPTFAGPIISWQKSCTPGSSAPKLRPLAAIAAITGM